MSLHESNHHGPGGPCDHCEPCPYHGEDCPNNFQRIISVDKVLAELESLTNDLWHFSLQREYGKWQATAVDPNYNEYVNLPSPQGIYWYKTAGEAIKALAAKLRERK